MGTMKTLRAFPLTAALIAAASVADCQPKDVDGWGNLKWGMTVVEARSALGDQASKPTEKPGPNFILIDRIIINRLDIGSLKVRAAVMTNRDSEVISAVRIEAAMGHDPQVPARGDIFTNLKTMLIEKYGSPKNEDRKTDKGDIDSTVLWSFPSTSITLAWTEVPQYDLGYITINYKAVDKKALGVL